jgi:hypothetical protein
MVGPANSLNITQQGTVYFNGVSVFTGIDGSTTGKVLTSNGTGVAPSFQSLSTNYTNVNFAASPYTVLATDQYISVDTSGGAITLRFPNAPTSNREWVVKDRTGNAGINNITITTVGGAVLFDGSTSYVINANYGSVQLIFNGTSYEVF